MAENEVVDEFDKAFAEVAHAAEQTPEEQEKARLAAEAAAAKTPEQLEAERVAAEAAAKKATDEAAEAARLEAEKKANEGKTPEQLEAERVAAETAAKEAAEAKVREEAAAKVQAETDAKAQAEAAAAKKAKDEADAKARADALAAAIAPYELTEEEKKADEAFKKEFPQEYAAMQARLKGVDKETNAKIHAAITAEFAKVAPRIAEVGATVEKLAIDQHFAQLRAQHPDYDAVSAKLPDWIKTLPAYAQAGAQAVYDGGSTAEVAALVADYKKATNVVVVDTGAAEVARLAAEKAAAAKAKAQADADALLPVGQRRSTPQQRGAPDKNDFDGAFAEAAATL